eukprot:gnl/MRDRNA2_/MRDRNA2_106568_c0_seq1.p1 gnl/MRDRNA2_/MRDRNA2_106568_c0~~gnl/MRDRNA2_/MRDRNA2_106568_c0_seq1.p1  ORF type:complete len:657 (-),score=77.28 gnl/MRDRNA2_/MRDRNA2_106568_c0_seq1:237-1979(-)
MTSVKTQLPFSLYILPYCTPDQIYQSIVNLGEILAGDLVLNTPFDIHMRQNKTCAVLCKRNFTAPFLKNMVKKFIDDEYTVNLRLDNLPAATRDRDQEGIGMTLYNHGYPVGSNIDGRYYFNNHFTMHIKYHAQPGEYEGYRIVAFDIEPKSLVQATRSGGKSKIIAMCGDQHAAANFDVELFDEIVYTYDVIWTESPIRWASRWDNYMRMPGGKIHWFSIVNSIVVVFFLSGLVAMILLRTLARDIASYNSAATAEEVVEEVGWKLCHGDIFRAPKYSRWLFASVGSGLQLLSMAVVTMIFALFGFLAPVYRGAILQSLVLVFTMMGSVAGYASSRLYKTTGGEGWKACTLITAFFYPAVLFGVFFFINLLIWEEKSSGAVPFPTMFALLVLWFGVSAPLVFLGAYFGYRKEPIELPVKVNQIARHIPAQAWYMHPILTSLCGGILPFGAIFTELFFIMTSLWQHQFYYLFGFLALVVVILVITCAEISITLTYFQLTAEDHRWWYRAFFSSGSSALYVFAYSMWYFKKKLRIRFWISATIYFGYMAVASYSFFLITGAIGCVSSFLFLKAIYGAVKVD